MTHNYTATIARERGWMYVIETHRLCIKGELDSVEHKSNLSSALSLLISSKDGKVTLHALTRGEFIERAELVELVGEDLKHRLF